MISKRPDRHSGLRPLLSGQNTSCRRRALAIIGRSHFLPANLSLLIRRPGESRGPVTLTIFKSLGPGFRRDDEVSRPAASIGDFPRTAVGLRRNDGAVFLSARLKKNTEQIAVFSPATRAECSHAQSTASAIRAYAAPTHAPAGQAAHPPSLRRPAGPVAKQW